MLHLLQASEDLRLTIQTVRRPLVKRVDGSDFCLQALDSMKLGGIFDQIDAAKPEALPELLRAHKSVLRQLLSALIENHGGR